MPGLLTFWQHNLATVVAEKKNSIKIEYRFGHFRFREGRLAVGNSICDQQFQLQVFAGTKWLEIANVLAAQSRDGCC